MKRIQTNTKIKNIERKFPRFTHIKHKKEEKYMNLLERNNNKTRKPMIA